MQFKDPKLENKFLKRHRENLELIGKLYLLSVTIISLLYFGYLIYRKNVYAHQPELYTTIPIDCLFLIFPVLNYFLSKKVSFL
jgi:uncharacterized membrane protein YozB (DUF420 family)